jgi:hypothetical protein
MPYTSSTASTARLSHRAYRFLFRGRIIGNFEWICPACGHFNRSHMRPVTYTLACGGSGCGRSWGLGHALHELPMTRRAVPDDYTIPQGLAEAMPEGDVGRWWKSGRLMHCVHTETGELAVPEASGTAKEAGAMSHFDPTAPGPRPPRSRRQ